MAADSDCTVSALRKERRQDAYYWRFLVTALSFAAFGAGAAIVSLLLLPLVRVLPTSPACRRERARAVIRGALRLFIELMSRLRGLHYEFRGRERLGRPGQLIVANHPTLIDVVFLLAFVPGAGCVVKQGLSRNPLTRGALALAEYITNEPTPAMIEAAASALRDDQTLIIFPEGTRTRPDAPLVFHRGAANVALRSARVLTPVYIHCEPATLAKTEPWYRIPRRRPRFTLEVGRDWDLEPYRQAPLPRASRALNADLQAHFRAHVGLRVRPESGS